MNNALKMKLFYKLAKKIILDTEVTPENIKEELDSTADLFLQLTLKTRQQYTLAKSNFNKYSSKLEEAITELTPLFELEFKDLYPKLNIKREVIYFSILSEIPHMDVANQLNLMNLLPAATIFLKYYFLHRDYDPDKYIKFKNLVEEVEADFEHRINNIPEDPYFTRNTELNLERVITERNKISTETNSESQAGEIIIPDFMLNNQQPPDTPERKRFDKLLELIDNNTIIKLKELYYNYLKALFHFYLEAKNTEIEKLDAKNIRNKYNLDKGNRALLKSAEKIIKFELLKYYNSNAIEKTKHIYYTDEELNEFNLISENIDYGTAYTLAFAILYMLEKNDPTVWLYPPMITILNLIEPKFQMVDCLTSPLYSLQNDFAVNLEHTNIKSLKCLNPEAPLDQLLFQIEYNNEPEYKDKYIINFPQYMAYMTNCSNVITNQTQIKSHTKLLEKAGINKDKASLISIILDMGATMSINKILRLKRNIESKTKIEDKEIYETKLIQYKTKIGELHKEVITTQNNFLKLKADLEKIKTKVETDKKTETNIIRQEPTALKISDSESQKYIEEINQLKEKNTALSEKIETLKDIIKNQNNLEAEKLANKFITDYFLETFKLEDESEKENITLPYILKQKTTVFGGHATWLKQMQEFIPNAIYYPKDKPVDEQLLRNSETVWVQINSIGHPYYYKIAEIAKKHDIPLHFFSNASAKICAMQMVEAEAKLQESQEA